MEIRIKDKYEYRAAKDALDVLLRANKAGYGGEDTIVYEALAHAVLRYEVKHKVPKEISYLAPMFCNHPGKTGL